MDAFIVGLIACSVKWTSVPIVAEMVSRWRKASLHLSDEVPRQDAEGVSDELQGSQCHALPTRLQPIEVRTIEARHLREPILRYSLLLA